MSDKRLLTWNNGSQTCLYSPTKRFAHNSGLALLNLFRVSFLRIGHDRSLGLTTLDLSLSRQHGRCMMRYWRQMSDQIWVGIWVVITVRKLFFSPSEMHYVGQMEEGQRYIWRGRIWITLERIRLTTRLAKLCFVSEWARSELLQRLEQASME